MVENTRQTRNSAELSVDHAEAEELAQLFDGRQTPAANDRLRLRKREPDFDLPGGRLSTSDCELVRDLVDEGFPQRAIAEYTGVSHSNIGVHYNGECTHSYGQVTPEECRLMNQLNGSMYQYELAEMFGVSDACVSKHVKENSECNCADEY